MEPLGRFPRVLNGVPRENIEGPPRPDPRPKTRGAAGPEGFWPRVWPRGAFNILSRDSIEYSRNLPRGSIHHYTPKAFPQIVILSRSRRNQVKQNKRTTLKRLPMVAPRVSTGISFYQWWPLDWGSESSEIWRPFGFFLVTLFWGTSQHLRPKWFWDKTSELDQSFIWHWLFEPT